MEQVSCGAGQLYRRGGFYENPTALEQLARHPAAGAQTRATLFPAYAYQRPMPVHIEAPDDFRQSLLTYYGEVNRDNGSGASSALVELSNAVLAHNVLYVQGAAGRQVVYETYRPPDRPWSPLIPPDQPVEGYDAERRTYYLFLGSVGSFNYGHWLLDDFARLRAAKWLHLRHPRSRIVILLPQYGQGMEPTLAHSWDKSRAAAIAALLGNSWRYSVRFVEVSRAYSFRRLFYATPISFHPVLKSPEALAWVHQRMLGRSWLPRRRRGPARVLLLRRAMRGRGIENMDAVRRLLESRGFTSIDPEDLNIAEQGQALADAKIVVGVMGASMSNTVYCRPGTAVLHLAPHGWLEPFYWDLAAVRGHRYAACFGAANTAGPAHLSGFEVQEAALLRTLDALG